MTLGGPLPGLNGQMDIVKPGLVPKTTVWFRKREIPFFVPEKIRPTRRVSKLIDSGLMRLHCWCKCTYWNWGTWLVSYGCIWQIPCVLPARSAYKLFCEAQAPQLKETGIMKLVMLGAMWKELPVSKKAVYQEKADQVRLSSWEPCGRNFLSPGRWSTRKRQTR